jgi:hypothetical protein
MPVELALEQGAFPSVPAEAYGAGQFLPRLLGPTELGQQLAAHARQQVGPGEPLAGEEVVDDAAESGSWVLSEIVDSGDGCDWRLGYRAVAEVRGRG